MADPIQTLALPTAVDVLAIGVGGISGALHAHRRHLDLMGILVVSFCGALGGGVIRDILLVSGPPVFLTSSAYLVYALVGAGFGWFFAKSINRGTLLIEVIDGLFIGVWVLVGATKALGNGLSFGSAVLVAVITATGGGVLRDLFCGEQVNLLLPGTWLAAAALMGALTFVGMFWMTGDLVVSEVLCVVVASTVRMVSQAFGLRTPMPMDVSKVLARR
jgi:uncharacterized membrane protein YeiH